MSLRKSLNTSIGELVAQACLFTDSFEGNKDNVKTFAYELECHILGMLHEFSLEVVKVVNRSQLSADQKAQLKSDIDDLCNEV